ncbi:hypothetical protein EVG20_g2671 [Dentipellis fragilis]|uniref:Phosphoglucomutase n=1 Tax=Dentipellis fragilis TaxID=205917 RepID=A0A4Y9Z921_9AGAM|nr:hypothetical protein EVG20_g2671 [Dentipellis fragilis]
MYGNVDSSPIGNLVKEWLRIDQNPDTRKQIEQLWNEQDLGELDKRMSKRIEFGTAGLRGRMEAGWSRMNDLVIIQAAQGLCAYVIEHVKNATERGVVIGHDHRYHSEHWAALTASAFIACGVKVHLLHGLVHTPMIPFSVKKLSAACGVMITASHNPKDDNGFKVYWENAVQIISPHDQGIAQAILENLEPKTWDTETIALSDNCIDLTDSLIEAYHLYLQTLCHSRTLNAKCNVKFVNTSMHGVSHPFVTRAWNDFSFPPFITVEEQQNPHPDFPTLKFPNPEEKGALASLDLAIATADREGAMYILAQDPDADRFSAAERGPSGEWNIFTGDQIGALFASRVLELHKSSGKPIGNLAMVASTVSSKMLEAMAKVEGFWFVECLTGFKFIGNMALTLEAQGYEVPFGYEEAIGFMLASEIKDKDGVAATIFFAELVAMAHAQGKTTSNGYFICNDPKIINKIFQHLRNFSTESTGNMLHYPTLIANLKITSIRDLTTGYDSANPPTYKATMPLSSGHMIQFRASDANVKIALTIRTSGTEPKIKYYLEGNGKDAALVDHILQNVIRELGDSWLEKKLFGLQHS